MHAPKRSNYQDPHFLPEVASLTKQIEALTWQSKNLVTIGIFVAD
jgi:hypothetical protein